MSLIPPFLGLGNTRYTITDGTNLVLSTALTAAGYSGAGGLIEVYLEGTIGTSGSGVALTIDDTGADLLVIYNNADIYGYGGRGGDGVDKFTTADGDNGTAGGNAILATAAARLVNNGSINGGGGGGAGAPGNGTRGSAGGGGGAGLPAGAGGSGGFGDAPDNGAPGSAGTLTTGGAFGFRYFTGGNGGDLGAAGQDAGASATGGAAGLAISGVANLTLSGSGTINGATA